MFPLQCKESFVNSGNDTSIAMEKIRKDVSSMNILHGAVAMGKRKLVKLLIEGGVAIDERNDDNQTALIVACLQRERIDEENNLRIIQFLIEKGANPNLKDSYGKTCLYYAKKNNSLIQQIIKFNKCKSFR